MGLKREVGWSVGDWTPPPAPEALVLEGTFARLERLNGAAHAADLHAANQVDGRIWDYLGYGPFATEFAYRLWADGMAGQTDPYFYALVDRATGKAGGVASYLRVTPAAGSIEVGHINLAPVLQGSRIATEAMFLMMSWVFAVGYRRYEWKCDALNLPSRRAAERFGFTYEGVFRQHMVYKGRNRDTAWFAVIDADWPALRSAYQRWLAPDNFDANGQQRSRLSDVIHPLLSARDPVF